MKRPLSPRAKKNLRIMRNIHLAVLSLVVLALMGIFRFPMPAYYTQPSA